MSDDILHQREEERKRKGRLLFEANAVSPNGAPGCFYVASQSDPTRRYVVNLADNTCTCQDTWGREHVGLCKHIVAAHLFDRAELVADQVSQHYVVARRCFELAEGFDAELLCKCGHTAFGFSAFGPYKAFAAAFANHDEHIRLVREHAERCPADAAY